MQILTWLTTRTRDINNKPEIRYTKPIYIMSSTQKPIGIFYEHPEWFKPLFAELERRNLPYARINAAEHRFNPADTEVPFSIVINRMSSSAYLRDHVQGIFHTTNYLTHVESLGVPVINGVNAQTIESSKSKQLTLFSRLDLPYPRTRVVNHVSQILPAALELRFPIVVKVNIGGSGAGIIRFDTREGLEQAIANNQINLGIDYTALVQEFIPARDGHIVRIETLNGKFLYSIKVYTTGESFNLCPAEICQVPDPTDPQACLVDAPKKGIRVEAYEPPTAIIEEVEKLVQAAKLDVGGIEYLVDNNGQHYFYDINALSNFVADAVNIVGFDPYKSFVDYIEQRLQLAYALEKKLALL